MRNVEFRGITNTYKMVYGNLFKSEYGYKIYWETGKGIIKDLDWAYVKENTIGQFTGLHDKNGIRIFEGDIIERVDSNAKFIVVFNGDSFCIQDSENLHHNLGLLNGINGFSNVIGNIHQNKEMLK